MVAGYATPLSRLVAETGGFASLSHDKFAKSHVVLLSTHMNRSQIQNNSHRANMSTKF